MTERYFAVLFHGDRFKSAIEARSEDDAMTLCHGYDQAGSDFASYVFYWGETRGFDDEMYLAEHWPADAINAARAAVNVLGNMPANPGQTIDHRGWKCMLRWFAKPEEREDNPCASTEACVRAPESSVATPYPGSKGAVRRRF